MTEVGRDLEARNLSKPGVPAPPVQQPRAAPPRAPEWPDLSQPSPGVGGGEHDAAVVVGIEKYAFVPGIPGAEQNARVWFMWLTGTRKVPLANISILRNQEATKELIANAVEQAASDVGPKGTLWFVFIGHGAPAQNQKDGLLVGADAQESPIGLYSRSFAQAELLASLKKGAQARTVVVLDACFSGRTGTGEALSRGLQPLIATSVAVPKGVALLSAGKPSEFAGPLLGQGRPAFSYLLLGAIRGWGDVNGDGQVTSSEAMTYARDTLRATVKDRIQTPQSWGDTQNLVLSTSAREKGPDVAALVLAK